MSKKVKWWILVRSKADEHEINHLVYATCCKAAVQMLSPGLKVIYNGQATWRMVCQLTGCEKPTGEDWNKYAKGQLFFTCNEQSTILYPCLVSREG